jgi:hypothetical protein
MRRVIMTAVLALGGCAAAHAQQVPPPSGGWPMPPASAMRLDRQMGAIVAAYCRRASDNTRACIETTEAPCVSVGLEAANIREHYLVSLRTIPSEQALALALSAGNLEPGAAQWVPSQITTEPPTTDPYTFDAKVALRCIQTQLAPLGGGS